MDHQTSGGTVHHAASRSVRAVRAVRVRNLAALAATLAVVGAACASTSSTSAPTVKPTAGAGATTSAAPAVSNDWALAYTGGKAGKADPALAPVTIGYINQEGGVPSFPEATVGLDAAVQYVNDELGGAQGHPIKIEKCVVQSDEDGQKCATQMLNDDAVKLVMTGVLVNGNAAVYSVLGKKKPVFIGFPSVPDDFTAQNAFAFTPGAVGVVRGLPTFIHQYLPNVKKIAVVHADNASGKASVDVFLKPGLAKVGITEVKDVGVADTATSTDLASAIQAVGGDKADLVMPFLTVQGCAATYDALKSLGATTKVLTTGLCYGTPMTKHLKDVGLSDPVPNGWYFADLGYSYFMPDKASGMETYLAKIKQYGPPDAEYTGFAGPAFANLLTAAKLINQLGVDKATPAALTTAARSFKGPMMLIAGPMRCGFDPLFKSLCGTQMGVQQYKDGTWTSIANALNGKAIETAPSS